MFNKNVRAKTRLFLLALMLIVMMGCAGEPEVPKQVQQEHDLVEPTNEVESGETDSIISPLSKPEDITPTSDSLTTIDSPIFFPIQRHARNTVEVWQIDLANNEQKVLFESPARQPVSILPPLELSLLEQSYFCQTQPEDCPSELNYTLTNLKLSPNKLLLAWQEGITWCPNTGCFGLNRIVVFDLVTQDSHVLVEFPLHADTTVSQTLGEIVWSPNSQQITFPIHSRQEGWSFVRAVDVETRQVNEIGEGLNPLAWSPDSEFIAMTTRIPEEQKWAVEIIDRTGQLMTTFGNWELVESIDWSPDATKLAVTALAHYQETGSSAASLFVIDLGSNEMVEINLAFDKSLDYSQPHWSPDGQLLGINISEKPEETQTGKSLVIFHPASGEIKTSFTPEFAFDKWIWGYDEDIILMVIGGDFVFRSFTPQEVGILHWKTGEFKKLILPPELEEELKNQEALLGNPSW
jgi:hypothetical protein